MEGLIPLAYRALRRHSSRRNYQSLQAGEVISESHGHMGCFGGSSLGNHEGKGRFRKGKSLCLRMQDFGEVRSVENEEIQQNNEIMKRKRDQLRSKSLAF